ncbi:MAG: hypothetical protein Q8941_12080 [Bacteroidota bacterium]|nr:hypothetical protein [Bacteroidota bacterium]
MSEKNKTLVLLITVIFIWRLIGNQLAGHWAVSDVYGMMQQPGVIRFNQ